MIRTSLPTLYQFPVVRPLGRFRRAGMGDVTLPVIGTVPNWLLIAAAAVTGVLLFTGRGVSRARKVKRIVRRVTEY